MSLKREIVIRVHAHNYPAMKWSNLSGSQTIIPQVHYNTDICRKKIISVFKMGNFSRLPQCCGRLPYLENVPFLCDNLPRDTVTTCPLRSIVITEMFAYVYEDGGTLHSSSRDYIRYEMSYSKTFS